MLSSEVFNEGYFGLNEGKYYGEIVKAKFKLLEILTPNSGPSPVPLPGAVVLMGTVLAGSAGLARWRKRQIPVA